MIVTISNQYGSGALAIGREAAERLGYEFVDEQLPVVVAKRLHTSPESVDVEDASPGMGQRMLRGLELGTPELRSTEGETFEQECLREVREAVREYASRGNVVLFGRGASGILGPRPDVLRVFLCAPRDWRVERIAELSGVDRKTAQSEMDRIDRSRRDHMRDNYEIDWTSAASYDLCIDTASIGREIAVSLIERAVGALS
jgi:cytidylate kinase